LRFQGRCYRGHDPAWSFTPISGEGAALTGGRFNRKKEPTLYLSLDVMTAFGECTQGFSQRLLPLTMCEYDVDCDNIADLRSDAGRLEHGIDHADIACPWLEFLLAGKQAPSWLVVDRLKERGFCGMLVPSFFPGANPTNINLVLWRWGGDLPHRVTVFDPGGRLPADQLSWPKVKPAR
jgi:RES domain-containing protein